jgi:serine/threonine protein kinase
VDDEFPGYQILEKIGEGGCGLVYRAAQTGPVRREVAIKVIKLGMDTCALITRFEAERQALARMDHPNIARVFDAGVTGRGRPFFVMGLVAGEPITGYCDRMRHSVAQRLELFLHVCDAVRHAHLKGIIHRDLKPSNILVTETDGRAVPKVIDFGVAKAMDHQRLADQTIYTVFDQFVGTPAYMSPEQAEGRRDVDHRTDLWAVGVMLFEMVSGRLPFGGATAFAVVGEVLHAPIPRLESVVSHADPRLAQIVARCLDRDPGRRFASARELGAALESLLPKRASAVIVDFADDATLSRKLPRHAAPPAEISDTATTAVVAPRALAPALTPPAAPRRRPTLVLGIASVVLLFVVGLALGTWLRAKPVEEPVVQPTPPLPVPVAASVPAALGPTAASEPAKPAADAGHPKKAPVRALPCPKDKLLIDPATGKLTCVRK